MNAVRSVAGTHHDISPLRPPRLIKEDHIVTPYSANDALGAKILNVCSLSISYSNVSQDTDRGDYAQTDDYITHAPISDKCALIVTSK